MPHKNISSINFRNNTQGSDFGYIMADLILHNFYIFDTIDLLLRPLEPRQNQWIYAYSKNETLLNMTP